MNYMLLFFMIITKASQHNQHIQVENINNIDIDSVQFGFTTPQSSHLYETNITITIFLNNSTKYQCQILPNANITYYLCDSLDRNKTSQCLNDYDYNNTKPSINGIQIDNNNKSNSNPLKIDEITISDKYNRLFTIQYFCSIPNCVDILDINSFHYISLDTNINSSNSYLMNISATCEICTNNNSTNNTILTPFYGWPLGGPASYINQGRITGITSWGIWTTQEIASWLSGSVGYSTWTADDGHILLESSVSVYPSLSYAYTMCDSFMLEKDDYFNGYRVIYTKESTSRHLCVWIISLYKTEFNILLFCIGLYLY